MSQTRGDNLDTAIDNLKSYAIADSTKALYSVGFELYVKFLILRLGKGLPKKFSKGLKPPCCR
jgi:prefoldin subunit 5